MGPDLVRPLRSTCFVGPTVFSQSIPPSKTKYGLIAFRARARGVRRSLGEGGARSIREATQLLTDAQRLFKSSLTRNESATSYDA